MGVILLSINCIWAKGVKIEPNGVGDIRLGKNISDLPKKSKGVYDKIVKENLEHFEMGEYTLYTFILNDNTTVKVEDYLGNGEIENIEIVSNIGEVNGLSVGMKVKELLKNKKVKQTINNDGSLFFELNGCLLKVNELKDSGYDKLQKAYSTGDKILFVSDDFPDSSFVESIYCIGESVAITSEEFGDKKSSDNIIMSIILFVAIVSMTIHMVIVTQREEPNSRVFTCSWVRISALGIMLLCGILTTQKGFFNVTSSIILLILVLIFCYYAWLRPKLLFLTDKPSAWNIKLPNLLNSIDSNTSRMQKERELRYNQLTEELKKKIEKEYHSYEDVKNAKMKLGDADNQNFIDMVYIYGLKVAVILIVTLSYIILLPYISFYQYFKNYILAPAKVRRIITTKN